MKLSKNNHSSQEEMIKNGSFYTPDKIVDILISFIQPFLNDNSYIFDFGVGHGAFISRFVDHFDHLYATDSDQESCDFIKESFPRVNVYYENSLININREKYQVGEENDIIAIGNPPYNDVTSQYQKGNKGFQKMDDDVLARDLGISFLKMYDKIGAKYVCVLHPLSYLIKKTNFNSLGSFKNHYKLIKAEIFSSQVFENIENNNIQFPVVIALYERCQNGMISFDNIKDFEFHVLDSDNKFSLNSYETIDGIINKYPTKAKSDTDLQFYTIRDINALKRNKTFLVGHCNNGIKVDIGNLYQYAWLDYFKHNFNPTNSYLFGNLSPLYSNEIDDPETKKELISYVIQTNSIVSNFYKDKMNDLLQYYEMDDVSSSYTHLGKIISKMNRPI